MPTSDAWPVGVGRAKMDRQSLQHPSCRSKVARTDHIEGLGDSRFHRAVFRVIYAAAASGQSQYGPPAVAGVVPTDQKTLVDESLEHARQRARMHV